MTFYLDYETYYAEGYRLAGKKHSGLTTEQYIMDPRFQEQILSIARGDENPWSFSGPDGVKEGIASIDWANEVVVAHNAMFDVGILSFQHGVYPGRIIDSLAIARAVYGLNEDLSLADLAERFGLPPKTVPYRDMCGKRFEDMEPDLLDCVRSGCEQDVILLREITKKLLSQFPPDELDIVDMTIRMFTEPQFLGDRDKLKAVIEAERKKKRDIASSVGTTKIPDGRKSAGQPETRPITEADLRSTKRFVSILGERGIIVPTKKTAKGEGPAIAKADRFMIELKQRIDDIGDLVRAKEICNSAINERRAERLINLCSDGKPLSVQLQVYGTETMRWAGGGDKCNFQNMPRDGLIRECLMAPPGKKLIVLDFSQVEYRDLCAVAGQQDKLDALAAGRDIYCEFSTEVYGRLITNTKENKAERGVGKVGVLSSGYGSGAPKLQGMCWSKGLLIPIDEAEKMKLVYRKTHPKVVEFWKECDAAITKLARGHSGNIGPIEINNHDLILPNGLKMHYDICFDAKENRGKPLVADNS